ncbi:hypothetical protein [Elizabethkingia miricola]|uniref:hypothetical protein n=1 Tax=Elizabethkingia miricola TaxID=172045 RepID=UPI0038915872
METVIIELKHYNSLKAEIKELRDRCNALMGDKVIYRPEYFLTNSYFIMSKDEAFAKINEQLNIEKKNVDYFRKENEKLYKRRFVFKPFG